MLARERHGAAFSSPDGQLDMLAEKCQRTNARKEKFLVRCSETNDSVAGGAAFYCLQSRPI